MKCKFQILTCILIMIVNVCYAQMLFVSTENGLEVYDISVPLVPLRVLSAEMKKPVKIIPSGESVYFVYETSVEIRNTSLELIGSLQLNDKISQAVFFSDQLYIFSDYRLTIVNKDLSRKRNFTFSDRVSKVTSCKSGIVILHANGKIVAYNQNMNKFWELSASGAFQGVQSDGDFLFVWTQDRLYVMNIAESVPTYEKEIKISGGITEVFDVKDNLLLLNSHGMVQLVSLKTLKIIDELHINAKSMAIYDNYAFAVTSEGTVRVINVLPSSLKVLQTLSSKARFAILLPDHSTAVKQPEAISNETEEKKYIEFIQQVKLPAAINTSITADSDYVYSTTLTGELISINRNNWKVSSSKIAFITTADPVILRDGAVAIGSWDSSIYLVKEKVNKLRSDSAVSISVSQTPYGFCAGTDNGTLYHFNDTAHLLWSFNIGAWLVCPPISHETFGIFTLDWLGILRLVDFSGNLKWFTILESGKFGEVIANERNLFCLSGGKIYSVEPSTGKILWSLGEDIPFKNIVCSEKLLFALSNSGGVYAIDFSGRIIWKKDYEAVSVVVTRSGGLIVLTPQQMVIVSQIDSTVLYTEQLPCVPTNHAIMLEDGTIFIPASDRILVYKIDDEPSDGWPMYLKDALNSCFFAKTAR